MVATAPPCSGMPTPRLTGPSSRGRAIAASTTARSRTRPAPGSSSGRSCARQSGTRRSSCITSRRSTCAAAGWLADGLPPIRMSVNLSPRQAVNAQLPLYLVRVLADSGLPPALLELEVAEGGLMEHGAATASLLQSLRRLGVDLCIDDFGTGYSSLAYLRRLPVQAIKLDPSFLAGLPDDHGSRAIVSAVIGMAHSLDMRVIAEGVEQAAQVECLDELGCDLVQGWLYARAMPADEFLAWYRAHPVCAVPAMAEQPLQGA
ncbi:MAG: hypothetical protein B7X33_02105 [Lysobacterales bacterium 13-68-4]|nr:MAG: hypothetical protein B7X33_02105 [Xanthomonadales bacterium 13-68-4]